jgi:hypothetical protein
MAFCFFGGTRLLDLQQLLDPNYLALRQFCWPKSTKWCATFLSRPIRGIFKFDVPVQWG